MAPKEAWSEDRVKSPELPKVKTMSQAEMEDHQKSAVAVQKYYEAKARREIEEDDEHVQELLQEGALSEAQVKGMAARKAMHRKNSQDDMALSAGIAAAAGYVTAEQMIEEHLDDAWTKKSGVMRMAFEVLGLHDLQVKINRAQRERRHPEWEHPYPRLHRVVTSGLFEATIGVLIVANGITIGMAISLDLDELPEWWELLEHMFILLFVLEIVGRALSSGWTWFFGFENAMDVGLIVFTGVIPLWILGPLGFRSPLVRALQLLRVMRLIRLVRMVRTLKRFRILWELIQGVTETRLTLLWIWTTMGFMTFMLAVFCVHFIHRSPDFEGDPVAEEYFGNVPLSMVSLFQVLTLDSWTSVARPLMKRSPWVSLGFVGAIMVLVMVLLNLIVAVIVNNSFARKEQDSELRAADSKSKKEQAVKMFQLMLDQMDADGSGRISYEEYAEAVENSEELRDMLVAELGIEAGEELSLWDDVTMPNQKFQDISIREFVHALRMMSGEAKARESFRITRLAMKQNQRLQRLQWRIRHSAESARDLRADCRDLQEEVAVLLQSFGEFLQYSGSCVPLGPTPRSEGELGELLAQLHTHCARSTSDKVLQEYRRRIEEEQELLAAESAVTPKASPMGGAAPKGGMLMPRSR